jgi:hypothetical protein
MSRAEKQTLFDECAYSDDSVHPVRRFRTRASEAAQRPTLGGLSR